MSSILQRNSRAQLAELPENAVVETLDLSGHTELTHLPAGLTVRKRLILNDCTALTELPPRLTCGELIAQRVPFTTLPADLRVTYRLDLEGCHWLESLPNNLKVGTLNLRGCTALTALPEGLSVKYLDISGCIQIAELPARATIAHGNFSAVGCWRLRALPEWLTQVAQLNVRDCVALTELPATLTVSSTLDIGDSSISHLPAGTRKARLLWRGIPVDERIAFHPETITAPEIIAETNVERRRVLMERMGYDAFLTAAKSEVLDSDFDGGGKRQLLRVPMADDEPLVCLAVSCPSTGRRYMLRVPPTTPSCRHGAAWLAGFDTPDAYQPLIET
jgi:hypothetical protein